MHSSVREHTARIPNLKLTSATHTATFAAHNARTAQQPRTQQTIVQHTHTHTHTKHRRTCPSQCLPPSAQNLLPWPQPSSSSVNPRALDKANANEIILPGLNPNGASPTQLTTNAQPHLTRPSLIVHADCTVAERQPQQVHQPTQPTTAKNTPTNQQTHLKGHERLGVDEHVHPAKVRSHLPQLVALLRRQSLT